MARNLLLAVLLLGALLQDGGEHRLVHFSDTHLPVAGSDATFAKAREALEGADCVVVTGDLTEFGGLDSLEKFEKVFATLRIPFVPTLGNHDGTWRSLHDVFFRRRGRSYYAQDAGPFRVLALDSSTCQDPRPHWDPAQLAWIASESAGASRWLVPSFHHPPWGGEFATPWARARLAVALGKAPVACLLTGHHHASATQKWSALRVVVGGAAQGKDAGFTTIETRGKKLVGTYHPNEGEARELFSDPLPRDRDPLPEPTVTYEEGAILVRTEGEARLSTRIATDGLVPGPRGVVLAAGDHGRITCTVVEVPGARSRFRVLVGSGVRTRPVILHGALLVGTECGDLVALDPGTGVERWRFATKGPLLGAPVAQGDTIVFGSGDGRLRAVSPAGELRWERDLGAPLYAAPSVIGEAVAVTDLDGTLHVLGEKVGEKSEERRLRFAGGPVEAAALIVSSTLVQGAWDQRLHAIDLASMKELWAVETDGPRAQKAKRYYSPADAPPVLQEGVLAVCDRDSKLTLLDPRTGARLGGADDAWAVAACEGGFVVKRARSLRRIALDASVRWSTSVRLGRTPAAPLVHGGLVWTSSDEGEACALDLETGTVVRRERVNPGELVLASPGEGGDLVYFGSLDGSVTALEAGKR